MDHLYPSQPKNRPLSPDPSPEIFLNPISPPPLKCSHHEYLTDIHTGDTICQDCGLVIDSTSFAHATSNIFLPAQPRLQEYQGKNPFSSITNRKLHTAFRKHRREILPVSSTLKIFDVIAATEGLSAELKAIILSDYALFLKSYPRSHVIKLLAFLLCLKYEYALRHIPFSSAKFQSLVRTFSNSKEHATTIFSNRRPYLERIRKVFAWPYNPHEWKALLGSIISKTGRKLPLAKAVQIEQLAGQIGDFYLHETRSLPATQVIFACSLVNIASFILVPILSCRDLASQIFIDYSNLHAQTLACFQTLVAKITKEPCAAPWAITLVRKANFF